MRFTKLLVVGVGSRLRSDDSVGPHIIDLLKKRLVEESSPDGFRMEVIDADVMPENFSKPIRESGADIVLFIDAVDMGLEPGELRIVPRDRIDAALPSSHSLPMSYLMDYVNSEIDRVEIVGVQVKDTSLFEEMTESVKKAAMRLAGLIWEGGALEIPLLEKDGKFP